MKQITTYLLTVVFVLLTGPAWAGSVTIPNTFTSGTKAMAADVNANFSAVKSAVDDNDTRISTNTNKINSNTSAISNGIAGANFTGMSTSAVSIASTSNGGTIVLPITLSVPSSGVVIVNASGYFIFNSGQAVGRCSVTTGIYVDSSNASSLVIAEGDNATTSTSGWIPFSSSMGFNVSGSGTYTYNLVCDYSSGNGVQVSRARMTAMFFSKKY